MCFKAVVSALIAVTGFWPQALALTAAVEARVLDELAILDTGPPVPPAALQAYPSGSASVTLRWQDLSADEDGFRIERRQTGSGVWTLLALTPANVTHHVDTIHAPGLALEYRVAATHAGGDSPWAGPASVVTVYSGRPLSDWVSVEAFGADGSDELDDTHAIQDALDTLAGDWGQATPHVLWFPDGTYLISDTDQDGIGVRLERFSAGLPANHHGLQIVGESPGGVVLQWNHPVAGTPSEPNVLFHNNGNPRSVWRNLIWDGGGRDSYTVAFDQSSRATPDGWYDAASTHIDSTFRNAYVGLRIGHFHKQNSELTIRRCRFVDDDAGVSIEDFNALNIWIWDSLFDGNDYGVSNAFGAEGSGDFRIVRGRFRNSARSDIRIGNTGDFTIRECWSTGSRRFVDTSLSTASSRTTLIGNRVANYTAPDGHALRLNNAGAFLLLDNRISSPDPQDHPVSVRALTGPTFPSDYRVSVVAMHNDFSVAEPYELSEADGIPCCKLTSVDDVQVAPFPVFLPALPPATDPLQGRNIYTANAGSTLQDIVDAAAADPVPAAVHLPNGTYTLSQTLVLPGQSDLLLIGNGQTTTLLWEGVPAGTMIDVDGFHANGLTLRDLRLHGNRTATALRVRDLNHDGSRVLLNKLTTAGPSSALGAAGVVVNRCDRTEVVLVDSGFDGELYGLSGTCDGPAAVGMRVVGGPQPQTGTFVWSGSATGSHTNFDVLNGPSGVKLLVSSFYQENVARYAHISGTGGPGCVTLHGGKMATSCSTAVDVVSVQDFTGNVAVANCNLFDLGPEGAVIGQWGGDVLLQSIANSVQQDPEYKIDTGAELVRAGTQLICQNVGARAPQIPPCIEEGLPGSVGALPTVDINVDPAAIDEGLHLLRAFSPPGHYDEDGARAPFQLNVDNVRIESPRSGIVLHGGTPEAPLALEASAVSGSEIELSWSDGSSNEDRFRVERSTTPAGKFVEVATTAPDTTSFADSGVSSGVRYYYRVAANRDRTGDSAYSNEADAIPVEPGSTPDGDDAPGIPLTLGRSASEPSRLDLNWGTSCSVTADDYAVYEGVLGDFTTHVPATCSTSGTTQTTLQPTEGSRYYLVVPLSESVEGSYGTDSTGVERPRSGTACVTGWETAACP